MKGSDIELAAMKKRADDMHRRAQKAEAIAERLLNASKGWFEYQRKGIREKPDKVCWASWRRGVLAGVRMVDSDLRRVRARAALAQQPADRGEV